MQAGVTSDICSDMIVLCIPFNTMYVNIYRKTLLFVIMKTSPCNVHPLTPHFYIVKLGFTGVYIIFLFLL